MNIKIKVVSILYTFISRRILLESNNIVYINFFRCREYLVRQKEYSFLSGTLVDKRNFDLFGEVTQGKFIILRKYQLLLIFMAYFILI